MGATTLNHRTIVKGGIYHVIQRAPGKESVFIEDRDYLYFLKLLKDTSKEFKIKLCCFALMPNHLHLLLEIEEENLSLAMQSLFKGYALYFNKKYERKGHVFSGRFRASYCDNEAYFLTASVYIHANPVKANLAKNLRDYRWTSTHLYIDELKESFVDATKILKILHSEPMEASRIYEKMLCSYIATKGKVLVDHFSFKKTFKARRSLLKEAPSSGHQDDAESILSQLQLGKRLMTVESQKERKYAVSQLLARGYEHREIQDRLKVSKATLYRIIQASE
jgi:putative transposase